MTAALIEVSGSTGSGNEVGVEANSNPSKNTIVHRVTKVDIIENRVGGSRFLSEDTVVGVEAQYLLVGGVRRDFLGLSDKGLVEE